MGLGLFDELVFLVDLFLGLLDLPFDLFELLGAELVADAQFVLAAVDVEEGSLEFLFPEEVAFAKTGIGDELLASRGSVACAGSATRAGSLASAAWASSS